MLGQVQSFVVAALCQVGEGAGGIGSQLQLGACHDIIGRAIPGRPRSLGGCCCAVYCRRLQVPATTSCWWYCEWNSNSAVTRHMTHGNDLP